MKRRSFLVHCAAGGAALALGGAGCRRRLGRAELLPALANDIGREDVLELVDASGRLESALGRFETEPSPATLRTARERWRTALLVWKRAQCFRFGPVVETNALLRTTYWPTRPALIEDALSASADIDDRFVNDLGVDGRGLFALEYLLFPLDEGERETLARYSGDAARRHRRLITALGRNVGSYARTANEAFADRTRFSRSFADNAMENFNVLVGELIALLESLAVERLQMPLELAASGMLAPSTVEGWPSGSSQEIALTLLLGCERVFRGGESGGLLDLTRSTAPRIAERVEERFTNAVAKLRAVGMPLERAARENRTALGAAASAAKALEIALKVDLVSALGVTLTFAATDGD
ncbi:MAG TPA: imelysin family protein [Polyangiaceae bacterium]